MYVLRIEVDQSGDADFLSQQRRAFGGGQHGIARFVGHALLEELVHLGDGTGAVNSIDRIVRGFPLKKVCEPVIAKEKTTPDDLAKCEELGMTLAAGISAGIY